MSAYLLSDSSASRLLSSPPPPQTPSIARAHLTSSLLTMGFPLSRINSLVSLLNPSQPNAIEVALELLTRDSPPPSPLTPQPTPPLHPHPHLPHPPPSPPSSSTSSSLSLLLLMTNCTPEQAHYALAREAGDINAAAEYILQRQERKEEGVEGGAGGGLGRGGVGGVSAAKVEEEERRREDARRRRRERRRVKAAEWRRVEEEGEGGGGVARRFLHFGDALLVRHVQSEELLTVDGEANAVHLAPYASTPGFSSPSPSMGRSGVGVTSPLTLPLPHSFHTPRTTSALPPAAPPSLSLASSPSPSSLNSRSLLSSSPPMKRTQGMGLGTSAFFPSTPPTHTGAGSSLPPSHPLASPPSLSLSHSPLRSSPKPRSFSSPRKSSHPLSLSLPSHHRYHLTLRRAPPSPTSPADTDEEREGGEGEAAERGLVMTGDRVVMETYERCYLCVEADGSVGCNRTAPLTQQMHFTLQVEEKEAKGGGEGGEGVVEEEDIRAVEVNAVVSLCTIDRHYVGVEAKHAVAKEARPSLSHHFSLSLAHPSTAHHRRHRHSASSLSPLSVATVPSFTTTTTTSTTTTAPPTAASLRWSHLRANFRLLALSVLQGQIAEKRMELMQKQRTQRLHREDAKRLCSICLDRSCDAVLLECGHSCACESCAAGLKECVVCRQKVQRVVVIRAI